MVGRGRIEALSDGLFAIVLTLLVLEIKPPVAQGDELRTELLQDLPSWISFGVTFVLGSVSWVDQHRVLRSLSVVSGTSVALNLLFLAFVTVLPFSTSLLGHNLRQPLADGIYFLNQLAIDLALVAQLEIAIARKQVVSDAALGRVRLRLASLCFVFACGTIGLLIFEPKDIWMVLVPLLVVLRIVRAIWLRRERGAVAAVNG